MSRKHTLNAVALAEDARRNAAVEYRKLYTLNHCELNIFETYRQCANLALSYKGMVMSSMMRGKKVMHLFNKPGFNFLPGETVIVPEETTMVVDFPEADEKRPVQCATLVIEQEEVNKTLNYLNEHFPRQDDSSGWALNFSHYHFYNNKELAGLINKLISISMEDSVTKDALADLTLKELLIRTIQTQNLQQVDDNRSLPATNSFGEVITYIRTHLAENININTLCQLACMSKSSFFRAFKTTFGLSPVEYIIRERIRLSKRLLTDPGISIASACYESGFNNLHYFSRIFKRLEGMAPTAYRQS